MDSTDLHWVLMKEAAEQTAQELGAEFVFMAPAVKDEALQIEQVNNAVARGCDAIVVAAYGPDSIIAALREAQEAGIKIVYVDAPANLEAEATVATDNYGGGCMAAETMLEVLKEQNITSGKIGIVNVSASVTSCLNRENGFRDAMEGAGYTLLEAQYCDGDASKVQTIAENFITQGCVAIYGCNEGCTVGTGNAIKASESDCICVGFDVSDAIRWLIDDGFVYATMVQDPETMGKLSMEAAMDALNGKELGGLAIDTGVSVLKK